MSTVAILIYRLCELLDGERGHLLKILPYHYAQQIKIFVLVNFVT